MVVFLGNPGRQYSASRHNVAWLLSGYLVNLPASQWKTKFNGGFVKVGPVVYLQPETYMNRSGNSVQAAAAFFGLSPAEILIVHDDMETDFGTVTMNWAGGHRGNNGVRSVIQSLGTADFWRLRIGVGRPPSGRKPGDWILERFTRDEEALLPDILSKAARAVESRVADPREETLVTTGR